MREPGVRDFPMPAHPNAGRYMWCRWCGDRIPKVINGKKSSQRLWHPHCKDEWQLHVDRVVQRCYVVDRDGEFCRICGEAPMRYFKGGLVTIYQRPPSFLRFGPLGSDEWLAASRAWHMENPSPAYTEVTLSSALELDHRVPLWSVADLSDDERRPFFHARNLWLLCPRHHKQKSAREAAERAAIRAFIRAQLDLPLPPP